jgi:hypothetical protein
MFDLFSFKVFSIFPMIYVHNLLADQKNFRADNQKMLHQEHFLINI